MGAYEKEGEELHGKVGCWIGPPRDPQEVDSRTGICKACHPAPISAHGDLGREGSREGDREGERGRASGLLGMTPIHHAPRQHAGVHHFFEGGFSHLCQKIYRHGVRDMMM